MYTLTILGRGAQYHFRVLSRFFLGRKELVRFFLLRFLPLVVRSTTRSLRLPGGAQGAHHTEHSGTNLGVVDVETISRIE